MIRRRGGGREKDRFFARAKHGIRHAAPLFRFAQFLYFERMRPGKAIEPVRAIQHMVREIDAAFLFAERIGKAVFFSRTEPCPIAQIVAHRRSEIAKAVFGEMKGQRPAVCIFRAKRPVEPIRAAVVLLGLEKIDHIVMLQIAVVRKGICAVGIIQKRHADAVDASDADGVPFACRRVCTDGVHTQSAAACKRVPNALFPSVHNMIVGKTKQIEARLFQRRNIAVGRVEREYLSKVYLSASPATGVSRLPTARSASRNSDPVFSKNTS